MKRRLPRKAAVFAAALATLAFAVTFARYHETGLKFGGCVSGRAWAVAFERGRLSVARARRVGYAPFTHVRFVARAADFRSDQGNTLFIFSAAYSDVLSSRLGFYLDHQTIGWPRPTPMPMYETMTHVQVPAWFVLLIGTSLTLLLARPLWREHRRRRCGLCPACGYDVRASTDRCPECGHVASGAMTEAAA